MNTYVKTICITFVALAASAMVTARPAEPEVVLLPAPVVSSLLQYLYNRPYQEVAGLMGSLQRCLQDQLPDDKNIIAERGNCPEIGKGLRQLKVPLAETPTPPKTVKVP